MLLPAFFAEGVLTGQGEQGVPPDQLKTHPAMERLACLGEDKTRYTPTLERLACLGEDKTCYTPTLERLACLGGG